MQVVIENYNEDETVDDVASPPRLARLAAATAQTALQQNGEYPADLSASWKLLPQKTLDTNLAPICTCLLCAHSCPWNRSG